MHSIATCEAVFEATREWVKQRKAFGRRVADLQTVQVGLLFTLVSTSSPSTSSPR